MRRITNPRDLLIDRIVGTQSTDGGRARFVSSICTPRSTDSCARRTRSRRGQQSDRPNGLLGARLQSLGGLLIDLLDPAAIVGIKCAPPEAAGARLGADETQPDRGCQCSAGSYK